MKKVAVALWIVLVGVAGYAHYTHYVPCAQPIEYRIGTLDPRFGVSDAQFKNYIQTAGNVWSTAAGKQLFEYNANGPLTINLVYDTRQQTTQTEQKLTTTIDQNTEVASSVKQQYLSLETSFQSAEDAYKASLASYNQTQSDYNEQVGYWNARGGAPSDEYAKLSAQKSSLDLQLAALEQKRQDVNALASQINSLIDKYNLLVSHINSIVDTINNDGLAGTEFEEGVYIQDATGRRINIYQYDNTTTFIRVVAHELGHSLGLEHNSEEGSIMNPVNQGKTVALSVSDIAELKAECGIK